VIAPGSSTAIEATPAAAPAVKVPSGPGMAAFDAILMLQNLAATTDMTSLEPAETTDLPGSEEGDEDESGEELEAALAFLSELMVATTTKGSPRDFEAGAQSQGEGAENPATIAPSAKGAVDFTETAGDILEATAADDAAEGKSLLASFETQESRGKGVESTQNLARAAELLATPGRSHAAAEKAAVATHVRDPRWADDFSNRVALMVRGAESTASLQLTPVDLGPVEVNVTVKDSQATIHFGASQAETRALIEASLPRLREMLAAQGFNLTDASVSSGFARSQQQAGTASSAGASEAESADTEVRTVRSVGLLDVYA
jgi:flagellar hook-length control protein FliK